MLRTERLILAPWTEADCAAFTPIATDPEVMRYITGGEPWRADQIHEFVTRQVNQFASYGYCMWKLVPVEQLTDLLVGFCGLQPLPGTAEIEIGWWLARSHWGRGLATEAARCVLRDGFERAGLTRIVAIARPENTRSIRVMEKLGMRFEKHTVYKGVPVVMYAAAAGR